MPPPTRKPPTFKTPGKPGSVTATVKGSPGSAGNGPQIQGSAGSPCLIAYPSTSLPVVGTVGGGCIISKTNVRAWVGGLLLGMGGLLFIGGAVVLVAAGFKKTGGVSKVAGAVGTVYPAGGAALRAAGSPGATITRRRAAAATQERRLAWTAGEPRENPNLRVGRGAVRETSSGTRRRRAERDEEPPF